MELHEDLAGAGLKGLDDPHALIGHGFNYGLVAEAQELFQLLGACGGRHVPFVELEHIGNGADIEAVVFEVRS